MIQIHRFSKSQLATFGDCAMRWAWRYIEGLKVRPAGAMKLGGSIHETAAHNFLQKNASERDLPLDEQTDFFRDNLKANLEAEEVDYSEDETPASIESLGVKMVKAHHATIAPKVMPESKEAVEERIWQLIVIEKLPEYDENGQQKRKNLLYTLPGLSAEAPHFDQWKVAAQQARAIVAQLEGEKRELELAYQLDSIIDVSDNKGVIRELKTKASAPNQIDVDKLVDLSQYSLARRMATRKVELALALDVVVKNVEPKAMTFITKRSRPQLEFHLNRIGAMARAIEARAFMPHTDWWGCSPKFCGYWSRCAGRGIVTVDQPLDLKGDLAKSALLAAGAQRALKGDERAEEANDRKEDEQESRKAVAQERVKEEGSSAERPSGSGGDPDAHTETSGQRRLISIKGRVGKATHGDPG